ncbi:heme exporter protein CcmD [Maritimibacter sp. DP1N21-5]|uniref:heme exporter protein CcmD n=1 Tax=Maritimibacter sp. DP1N21-5 TaxID=2836867 RepID=UPI001C456A9F|nr:heme exporter protein CcmD [Maritimibacter sp. DP1N21-5]MBV7410113.1 heme exporter protein CcmD [Maritimibacter sp. DP1N21-5]
MLDLGKYAGPVIWSWVATLGLMAAVIALTWWQSKRAKAALAAAEARRTSTS